MTRIFVDGHFLNGGFHGAATFLEYMYKSVSNNDEMEIVIGTVASLFKGYSNVSVTRYRHQSKFRLLFDIPRILFASHFDYAHFTYAIPFIRPKKCKIIVTIHDILYKDVPAEFTFLYRFLRDVTFGYAARHATIVTTISLYSRALISKYFHVDLEKIHILTCGLSKEFREPFDKSEAIKFVKSNLGVQGDYISFVSRIEPRKNHDGLLKAYIELKLYKKNISLVFIGKVYSENKKLSAQLAELSPEQKKHVYIFSELAFAELLQVYRASRMCVYPSKAEGFGIPIVESLALGVPTLFSNTTAMSEFSFASKYFIDPDDVESIKQKMLLELDSGIYQEQELIELQAEVLKEFCWNDSSKKLLSLLRD